ncbi:hypothetical protein AKJ09_10052 [Labilithrix luteola]|uniref:Uncharacterized protein n=1 Tax=Labilithrix luteola TaxID=1391654 RepID=A0A0K1QCB6_9BACT|nr:hypothetical protein [Labilithrix luteola]AKV03389.1 hypothetical protein AKJ09_10052 [Labilithrix luteola]
MLDKRYAGLIVLTALCGIHCSAPVETVSHDDAPITEAADPPPGRRSTPPSDSEKIVSLGDDSVEPEFTSSVRDASGNLYETGTFTRTMVGGATLLRSRGDRDVFVIKTAADGSPLWAISIGSAMRESDPKVTLDDGKVSILGTTKGQMDCGRGPLNSWSSETFFLCTFQAKDGTPIVGGAFPTGAP